MSPTTAIANGIPLRNSAGLCLKHSIRKNLACAKYLPRSLIQLTLLAPISRSKWKPQIVSRDAKVRYIPIRLAQVGVCKKTHFSIRLCLFFSLFSTIVTSLTASIFSGERKKVKKQHRTYIQNATMRRCCSKPYFFS